WCRMHSRYIVSVPTRRSSDLETEDDTDADENTDVEDGPGEQQCVIDEDCEVPEASPWDACSDFADVCTTDGTQSRQVHSASCVEDRKSTRLNSSHVKISYAVF